MSDDLVADGILPVGGTTTDDEFDPNAFESDDFLDDPDDILPDEIADGTAATDDDDDDILDE